MSCDPQAAALNDVIRQANPAVERALSTRGRNIFFPKLGVLSQSAEAAGKEINATVGIALEDDGAPVALASISKSINLPVTEAFPYAPSPGRPAIRKLWREMLFKNNPRLEGRSFGQPVVTAALTHGLSMAGYLFCDPGDTVILPDLYWENYDLVFSNAYGARLDTFPTYTDAGGLNIAGLTA
jgi:aspartate/methionine/tyrosine aminotransferase